MHANVEGRKRKGQLSTIRVPRGPPTTGPGVIVKLSLIWRLNLQMFFHRHKERHCTHSGAKNEPKKDAICNIRKICCCTSFPIQPFPKKKWTFLIYKVSQLRFCVSLLRRASLCQRPPFLQQVAVTLAKTLLCLPFPWPYIFFTRSFVDYHALLLATTPFIRWNSFLRTFFPKKKFPCQLPVNFNGFLRSNN